MRTAIGVTVGAVIMWIILAIWHGPTAWLFTRIEPPTHPDCHTRTRVWHHGLEQTSATWPE